MVAIFWTLFRVFNRTTVIGRGNVGYDRNILLLSNHQTMIDSFLIGSMCFYPQSWWKPYLMPWNPAAVENYYKNAFLAWFSDVHKCIPIREGRRDLGALRSMIKVLPKGVMTLFPEGTRMRGSKVGFANGKHALKLLGCLINLVSLADLHFDSFIENDIAVGGDSDRDDDAGDARQSQRQALPLTEKTEQGEQKRAENRQADDGQQTQRPINENQHDCNQSESKQPGDDTGLERVTAESG